MSLFSDIGETFERTKQAVVGGEDGQAAFVCTSCERQMDENHEYCPHCGEATVEPVE